MVTSAPFFMSVSMAQSSHLTNSDLLLAAEDLCVIRQGRHLLDRVSMRIHRGEHITLIGPNGAGKTLLLKVLLGIVPPDGGMVQRRAGLRVGYMPQRLHLSPLMPMTVDYFLQLAFPVEQTTRVEVLELTDTLALRHRSLHELSGGEMQRVLLARALLREPDLLLLDEPGQNMDVSSQLALYERVRQIQHARGCGVLMVSHDLHFVMRQTDQVLCLYHHICCSGRPQEIIENRAFADVFGPRIAEVMGYYHHQHSHTHEHVSPHDCREHQ
jgi:zinc transport system ATP-binding protein